MGNTIIYFIITKKKKTSADTPTNGVGYGHEKVKGPVVWPIPIVFLASIPKLRALQKRSHTTYSTSRKFKKNI